MQIGLLMQQKRKIVECVCNNPECGKTTTGLVTKKYCNQTCRNRANYLAHKKPKA